MKLCSTVLIFVFGFTIGLCEVASSTEQELNNSDDTAKKYLEAFTKSGVPTSDAVHCPA
jgi:hypothetical protein